MLDVHPPHEPVHGWRDFAVHLLTITVGLLIALGLESAVEALHHHELAVQARENIEHELQRNVAHAKENIAKVQKALDAININLAAARTRRDGKDGAGGVNIVSSWSDFEEAAWLTARESGALGHMPLDEVQRYADLYAHQQLLEREANNVMHTVVLTLAPLMIESTPKETTAEEWNVMMLRSADAKVQLTVFKQLVEGLARDYDEAQGLASPEAASAPTAAPASAAAPAASPASSSH